MPKDKSNTHGTHRFFSVLSTEKCLGYTFAERTALQVGVGHLAAALGVVGGVAGEPGLFGRPLRHHLLHRFVIKHHLPGCGAPSGAGPHLHGDGPRRGIPENFELFDALGFTAGLRDVPVDEGLDLFFFAVFDEYEGPFNCHGTVDDRQERSWFPVRLGFLLHQGVVLDFEASCRLLLGRQRVDLSGRSKGPDLQDLAEVDGTIKL